MSKKTTNDSKDSWNIRQYVLLVLVLSIIPLVLLFVDGRLWHTHDGLVHVPRLAAFYTALSQGHFPPRFAGYLNYGYGVPLFIFIYHLPYYIGSLFVFLGFSLVHAFKLSITLSYVLSGLFVFGFAYAFFKDKTKALWLTVFYQFAPFRFVELHVRGSYGEVYTYTFLPLTLWALTLLIRKRSYMRFVFVSFSSALLVMSHNSISLAFFGVALLFVLVFSKSIKAMVVGYASMFVGLLLSAWYFLPAILEHKYTYGNLYMKDVFRDHFIPWWHYIVPNLNNSESLQFEGITAQFGIMHVLAIVLAIILFLKKRIAASAKPLFLFGFVLLAGALFLMQPLSTFIWENGPFMSQFQFPWRLVSIVVVATSFLSISYLSFDIFSKRWVQIAVLSVTILSTAYYWRPLDGYDNESEESFWNHALNTTYYGETDVRWSEGPAKEYPIEPVEFVSGYAEISNYEKKGHIRTYTVSGTESAQLVDNTQYFPGWRVFVDGKKVPIQFQDINWRGKITFPVSAGTHEVEVVFGRSPVRVVSELTSVGAFVGLIAWGIVLRHRKRKGKGHGK